MALSRKLGVWRDIKPWLLWCTDDITRQCLYLHYSGDDDGRGGEDVGDKCMELPSTDTLLISLIIFESCGKIEWVFVWLVHVWVAGAMQFPLYHQNDGDLHVFCTDGGEEQSRFCNKNKVDCGSTCFALFNKAELPFCLLIYLLLHKLFLFSVGKDKWRD